MATKKLSWTSFLEHPLEERQRSVVSTQSGTKYYLQSLTDPLTAFLRVSVHDASRRVGFIETLVASLRARDNVRHKGVIIADMTLMVLRHFEQEIKGSGNRDEDTTCKRQRKAKAKKIPSTPREVIASV